MDCTDKERLAEAKEELWNILSDEDTRDTALLIFANKQDLPQATNCSQITDQLDLRELKDRPWYIQSTCAKKGEGLVEGLTWLADTVRQKQRW